MRGGLDPLSLTEMPELLLQPCIWLLNEGEESSRANADLPSYFTSKYTKYDQLSKLPALAPVRTYVSMTHVFAYKGKCTPRLLHLMIHCLGQKLMGCVLLGKSDKWASVYAWH